MKSKKAQKPVTPSRRYSSCSYCGGAVEERHIPVEMRFGEALVLYEHVPAGVCDKCGEEYLLADIQDKMIEMTKSDPDRVIQVKVYSFSDPLSVAKAEAKHKRREQETDAEQTAEDVDMHLASDDEITRLMETDIEEWDDA